MTKPLLALALLSLFAASVPAQTDGTDSGRRYEATRKKISQLDVLIQILPLALTKEEISPLLRAIEKVHQKQTDLEKMEAKDISSLDAKLTTAVDEGINKSVYPPRTVQDEVAALGRALAIRRQAFYIEMTDSVFAVCKATLNQGQLKTMEKSLKPELLDPSQKSADMDADAKIKFFVRKVILDPLAYDILVQMSKKKDAPTS